MAEEERVQKTMARLGIASRRASEELIVDGQVEVNGEVAELGDKVSETDELKVNGVIYSHKPDLVTYLLNKPAEVLSSASDDRGRTTVVDVVENNDRLFPIGRLDYMTEGLILITNDGDLAYRCTHPSFGLEKTYLVELAKPAKPHDLRMLREGVELEDGVTHPASVSQPQPKMLKLTIHEGRNRQVRRMCEAIGNECLRLVRTNYGPLSLNGLAPGEYRKLGTDDLNSLYAALGPR